MNKKLIALAVAGAVVAPAALAQSANPVTLYGGFRMSFENVKADGGTVNVSSRNRVSNQASYLGVRGTEDLGGGLKAFFQLESGSTPDTGATVNSTPATAIGGTLGSRNSAVGLQGDFGSLFIGKWDTPFKQTTTTVDPFGDIWLPGTTAALNDRGNFDLRPNNVAAYWSPNVAGFQAKLMYAANELKTQGNAPATGAINPNIVSMSAVYDKGPIFAGYSYEKHTDRTGSETAGVANYYEKGQAFFASYVAGPVKVGAISETFKKTNLTDQKSWGANIKYSAGNNAVAYYYQDSKDGASGTAALQPSCKVNGFGYFYTASKRTQLNAHYADVKNNASGACNFGANTLGTTAGNGTTTSSPKPKGISVGMIHTF